MGSSYIGNDKFLIYIDMKSFKITSMLFIGTLSCGLHSCTRTEYIEIERIVAKEDIPLTNTIFKHENQNTLISTDEWNGICFGQFQYMAVGNRGYFVTSLDGETWSEPVKTHKNDRIDWLNIEYANEMFLISGENQTGHYISYSKDGTNWSEPITDSGNGRMAFGNNSWIICDSYCIYVWNRDFTHKEQVEPSYDNARVDYYDVAFGNDRFVLVSSCANDGDVFTSTDGLNWKRLFTEISCQCITFDGKQFVAGSGGGRIWTSTDGENWTEHRALPSNFLPSRIKYENGNYIIAGTLNRYWFVNQFVATSKDGINWTDLEKVTDESINDICFITE